MKAIRLVIIILLAVAIATRGDLSLMGEALAFLGLFFVPIFIIAILMKVFYDLSGKN